MDLVPNTCKTWRLKKVLAQAYPCFKDAKFLLVGTYDDTILHQIDQLALEAMERGFFRVESPLYRCSYKHCERYQADYRNARPVRVTIFSSCTTQLKRFQSYALGCWGKDAYVDKYNLPTSPKIGECHPVPDSTKFYTDANAIADVSHLVSLTLLY